MDKLLQEIELVYATITTPIYKINEVKKITIRKIQDKNTFYQGEFFYERKVKHVNFQLDELVQFFKENIELKYKNIYIASTNMSYTILLNKKGNFKIKKKPLEKETKVFSHNREKALVVDELPFLIDLSVSNEEGFVKKDKEKKLKQINKFLEQIKLIENYVEENSTIIDCGSGKGYLTFAVYYYLNVALGKNVKVIGIELNKELTVMCNQLAEKYNYSNLQFVNKSIQDFETDDNVSLTISLHACDVATDYGIFKGIRLKSNVILAIPCCHKEFSRQIDKKNIFTKYGILKENFASTTTDAIRGSLLEWQGYKTQVVEFIDKSNTPKNTLIKGILTNNKNHKSLEEVEEILSWYNVKLTLLNLLKK